MATSEKTFPGSGADALALLPREYPRTFTRDVTDFGNWSQLEPLFERLAQEIEGVETRQALEAWMLRESELNAAIAEEGSRRYIGMTCDTDDEKAEKAYLHFVEKIEPKLKAWHDRLARLYLACPARGTIDGDRLAVLDRKLENQVELFREANVPLQTEESRLAQRYQKTMGGLTVEWHGEEKTLQQMAPYYEDTDRHVRRQAWTLVSERRLQEAETVNGLFDQLVALRTKIARNAGFDNFRDYQHQAYDRFDYEPADSMTFHNAIEQEAVPLLARLRARRRARLGVHELRPWDLQVDVEGRAALKPFDQASQLKDGCAEIFHQLDPGLGAQFDRMRELGLLDLASRKGKAPGGYQSTLEEVRLPFIFMNAAGTNRDVFTLLHEGGHAFHSFAARDEPLLAYRHAPMEFCEVASMAMELFAMDHLDVFYPDAADRGRSVRRHLEDMITIFPWIATIDAFQHWIYLNPDHNAEQRAAQWLKLQKRFSPIVDWSGLEEHQRVAWHRQLHMFEVPFYYIEYGIAQMGALQLWLNYREEPATALEGYRRALALGGSRPLAELFEAAGIRFDFSAATLRPLMHAVSQELNRREEQEHSGR